LVLDADINAARNIWHRGVEGLASRYSPSDLKAAGME
jgi:transposase